MKTKATLIISVALVFLLLLIPITTPSLNNANTPIGWMLYGIVVGALMSISVAFANKIEQEKKRLSDKRLARLEYLETYESFSDWMRMEDDEYEAIEKTMEVE